MILPEAEMSATDLVSIAREAEREFTEVAESLAAGAQITQDQIAEVLRLSSHTLAELTALVERKQRIAKQRERLAEAHSELARLRELRQQLAADDAKHRAEVEAIVEAHEQARYPVVVQIKTLERKTADLETVKVDLATMERYERERAAAAERERVAMTSVYPPVSPTAGSYGWNKVTQ